MDQDSLDKKVLEELDSHFSCKICQGVVLSAKSVDCGHIFCSYCLDLLQPMSQKCPECTSPIKSYIQVPQVDSEIQSLIRSCSPAIQKRHETAIKNRLKSSQERSEMIQNLKTLARKKTASLKSARNVDDVCNNLTCSIVNLPVHVTKPSMKSARQNTTGSANFSSNNNNNGNSKTPRNGPTARSKSNAKSRSRFQQNQVSVSQSKSSSANSSIPTINTPQDISRSGVVGAYHQTMGESSVGIDFNKVESLFSLYDEFLKVEPAGSTGASGDFSSDLTAANPNTPSSPSVVVPIQNDPFENDTDEMKALKLKHRQEIDILLKEAEGAIELDDFVQKWSEEITKFFSGEKDEEIESQALSPLPIDNPSSAESVDDFEDDSQMWKSSKVLIKQFKELNDSSESKPVKVSAEEIARDFANLDQLTTPRGGANRAVMTTEYDLEFEKLALEDKSFSYGKPKGYKNSNSGSKSSRKNDPSELSNSAVNRTFSFWTKIRQCKEALNKLKDNRITTPEAIRGLLQTQECNTSRIGGNNCTKINKMSRDPSTPRGSRLPVIPDKVKTPRQVRSRPSTAATTASATNNLPPITISNSKYPKTSRSRSRPNTTAAYRQTYQF